MVIGYSMIDRMLEYMPLVNGLLIKPKEAEENSNSTPPCISAPPIMLVAATNNFPTEKTTFIWTKPMTIRHNAIKKCRK